MESPNPSKSSPPSDEEVHRERLGDLTLSLGSSQGSPGQLSSESAASNNNNRLRETLQSPLSPVNPQPDLHKELNALRQQVERFILASQGSREGLWVAEICPDIPWYSPDCPVWYSPQFIAMLGYEESEFPGVLGSWEQRLHPEDRERVFEALTNHIEKRIPYHVESRLRTKSKGYRWFEATGEGTFDADGRLLRGGGTIRDITERKLADDISRRNHALLDAVLEEMSDVVYVKDQDGRYLLVNPSGAEIMGKAIHEVIGRTDQEIFGIHPHALFVEGDDHVMQSAGTQTFEIEVQEQHPVSRTFLVTKDSFGSLPDGQNGVLGFARDITFRKAAELIIQEREKRFRAIMENAYDLITEADSEGRFLYVSPNFKESLGYSTQDLLGTSVFAPVHPEDRDRVVEEFCQGMKTHGSGRSVYRYRHQNGEYRWFESTGRAFQTALGELRAVVISRDITQRKQWEDALKAIVKGNVIPGSPNFFEVLVGELAKALQVPMVFLSERIEQNATKARTLAFWNQDHFEPSSEYDCLGGPCEQVFQGSPVDQPSGVQHLFPRSETIRTLGVEAYYGIPLFNAQNEVVGNLALLDRNPLVLSSQGHSLLKIFAARAGAELERKRAQEEVQNSQDQYRELYDQTPLIYFTVNSQGLVLSVNQYGAQLLGYRVEELLGTSAFSVVYEEDRDLFQSGLEKGLRESTKGVLPDFRKVKKDGTIIWVKETIQAIEKQSGPRVWLLSCEDITERKRTEEALLLSEMQLRHTQKMEAIGTLAGGIAHDFNNILGAILGYSELAMAYATQDERLKSYLNEVVAAGNRARDLVKQILAFSRRSEKDKEAIDLRLVIRDVLKMVRASFPSSIEIRTSLDLDSTVIYGDRTQMQQVIMNLCANAEYAMREEGGLLEIVLGHEGIPEEGMSGMGLCKAGSYLQLVIRDSGKGIPLEMVERIFEPFFTTKPAGEGTGLGLAVVHGIVHNHGGGIAVSSRPGEGTTFTVLLPRLDVIAPEKSEEVVAWPTGSGRVLFVDDEEMLTRWGTQFLSHLGYDVVASVNPYEALDLFRAHPSDFDVVVTDQTMPTMSGEALSRALLGIRADIPILLCTGFSHTMTQEKAKQLGIRAFLMKPVNGLSLALALRDILGEGPTPDSIPTA
jgi:PAS domain S-box-containing protein